MNITVKMDESNNNKMTDYKVTALKTAGLVQVVDVENGLVRMKDYLDASGGSSVDVVDNLDSESATKALSANQGRVLNQIKANKADLVADYATKDYVIANIENSKVKVIDNLTTPDTDKALSANQGVQLRKLINEGGMITQEQITNIDSIPQMKEDIQTNKTSLEWKVDIETLQSYGTKEFIQTEINKVPKVTTTEKESIARIPYIENEIEDIYLNKADREHEHEISEVFMLQSNLDSLSKKIDNSKVTIVDNLTSTDTKKALSAKQGKVLAELVARSSARVNVLDIGIVASKDDEKNRANKASKWKEQIDLSNQGGSWDIKTFYFPKGTYHFDTIEITNKSKEYTIVLEGEDYKNGKATCVNINTNGQNFIIRNTPDIDPTKGENNSTLFVVKNMSFSGAKDLQTKPTGACFSIYPATSGTECNFWFENVLISCFEYGFKSPRWTCGGSRAHNVTFFGCRYGMYLADTSHNLIMDTIDFNNCQYGIRFGYGGDPCKISNIHVAAGCYSGMSEYLAEDEKMYAIQCRCGVVIDGIYVEQYGGTATPLNNFTLIDYIGYAIPTASKVIIRNVPVSNVDAAGKGKVFTGRTMTASGDVELKPLERMNYFINGCVNFENCIRSSENFTDMIKSNFVINGGLDQAFGFTFDNREIIGNGLCFSNRVARRFNTHFKMLGGWYPKESTNLLMYNYSAIPDNKKTYNGISSETWIYPDSTGKSGVHYKGTILLNSLVAADGYGGNLSITLGMVGNTETGNDVMFKEFITLNSTHSDLFGKRIIIYVDEFVSCKDYKSCFFGYKIENSDNTGGLSQYSTEKVIYNIETEILNRDKEGWETNSKSFYVVQ